MRRYQQKQLDLSRFTHSESGREMELRGTARVDGLKNCASGLPELPGLVAGRDGS
jgi:hypothetical protein